MWFNDPGIGKSQIAPMKCLNGYIAFSDAMNEFGITAAEATATFENFIKEINKIIPKEYKIMKMKLILMEARLYTLEGRNTECEAIRKKLRRQIKNLKAKMAEAIA